MERASRRGRGSGPSPPSACLSWFLPPLLSLCPSVCLHLHLRISTSPSLLPYPCSVTLPTSLSRFPLALPTPTPLLCGGGGRGGGGWGVSLTPDGDSFLSANSSTGAEEERRLTDYGARGMGTPWTPWPLIWVVLQLGCRPGWLLGTWLKVGWHGESGLGASVVPGVWRRLCVCGGGLGPSGPHRRQRAVWLWAKEVSFLGSPGGESCEQAGASQLALCAK